MFENIKWYDRIPFKYRNWLVLTVVALSGGAGIILLVTWTYESGDLTYLLIALLCALAVAILVGYLLYSVQQRSLIKYHLGPHWFWASYYKESVALWVEIHQPAITEKIARFRSEYYFISERDLETIKELAKKYGFKVSEGKQ